MKRTTVSIMRLSCVTIFVNFAMVHATQVPARVSEQEALRLGGLLAKAAIKGDFPAVQKFLNAGANPNVGVNEQNEEISPLVYAIAAKVPSLDIVEALLTEGANPNIPDTKSGTLPLVQAAKNGTEPIVNALLSAKAEVDAQETKNGRTALIEAVEQGKINIVKTLLKARADVNKTADSGLTALMATLNMEDADNGPVIVKLLLNEGANPYLQTKKGKTIFDFLKDKLDAARAVCTGCDPAVLQQLAKREYDLMNTLDGFLKLHTPERIQALKGVAQKALKGIFPRSAEGMAQRLAPDVQKFLRSPLPMPKAQEEQKEKADVKITASEAKESAAIKAQNPNF